MTLYNTLVYITRRIPEPGLILLRKHFRNLIVNPYDRPATPRELLKNIRTAHGLIPLLGDVIDKSSIDKALNLKIIANYAAGYDNIDVGYATQRGIMVTNTPDVLTDATAELTWALILSVARRITEADRFTKAGKFRSWSPQLLVGTDIHHKTLGIIGAGRIGQAVALKSRGFEMRILYTNFRRVPIIERKIGAKMVSLKTLLKNSDFVTLHTPLTPETYHLMGKRELVLMKSSAYLINTSRGPVVDEKALVWALKNKRIAGAGLDVYEKEPKIHADLFKLANVILLPHIGSATTQARIQMALVAVKNLIMGLKGKRPINLVNPEVWCRIK
ncbi:2-hydroxyacid dehydrogenase [Planctomycetota bacterium]